MTKYIKKRKVNNNNGKFKYVYFKVTDSKKERISSKKYYSFIRKKKQSGGKTATETKQELEKIKQIEDYNLNEESINNLKTIYKKDYEAFKY